MKEKLQFIYLISFFTLLTFSCSDHDDFENRDTNSYGIKEIVSHGKTNSRFLYNSSGNISESQSLIFYQRFTYDKMNRLVKSEKAIDPSSLSSSYLSWANKTELMSAKNCEISLNELFLYDDSGKLTSVENYNMRNGNFIYGSKKTFEYEGDRIVKMNYHLNNGEINAFNVYKYDKSGNVVSEVYYSNNYEGASKPTKMYETTFEYDSMNNPFRIFNETGDPGLYTNPNNVIETTTVRFIHVPGFEEPTISKTSYEYNHNDYPVKVIDGPESVWEYIY